ncbi:MAG: hypothetical protein DWQ01_14040 [Planctomycetota bacterium]|nr:MAG: hypothetical protein DWQ01_14040 [Planctomycetota bacterium]
MAFAPSQSKAFLATALLLVVAAGSSCFGGGGLSKSQAKSQGNFKVLSSNMASGDVWPLNRPILIQFNNPVDPSSIDFGSIILRPVSPEVRGNPVTGTFDILPGTEGKTIAFYPSCPTNATNDNGAFVPGGYTYELILPTVGTFGSSVLRDTAGHQLSVGLTRSFVSPTPPVDPLFIDTVNGPAILEVSATHPVFPSGLNLFSQPDAIVEIRFNQPVDGEASNLNTDNIYLLYEDAVGAGTYTSTNKVPGSLVLVQNCGREGALIQFHIQGLLPPERLIKLVVSTDFADLGGEQSPVVQEVVFQAPDLATFYGDPSFNNADETADEFIEQFATPTGLDPDAPLRAPFASITDGGLEATFAFPGIIVGPDENFFLSQQLFLEVSTDGTQMITDSNGRDFEVVNGVMQVNDFTIEAGATLRAYGSNPLVIYVNGEAAVYGNLSVNGDNASDTQALNSPHIPEYGASGQCGGGDGGTASEIVDAETLRGNDGEGPFGLGAQGGGGGEGAVQTNWALPEYGGDARDEAIRQLLAGGGAGGTFADGLNVAALWDRWPFEATRESYDNSGPDFRSDRHTALDEITFAPFQSGEDGMRGSSWDSSLAEPPFIGGPLGPYSNGTFGMEDLTRDADVDDADDGFDPAWTSGADPTYGYGLAQFGPDPGLSNNSPMSGGMEDDFWGRRYDTATDSVIVGELLTPWAGYGGGASGDCSVVVRLDLDGDSFLDPIGTFFPDTTFPVGTTIDYYKGAPGGGGAGQLLIMAIGPILLGPETQIQANGGAGASGESYWLSTSQVSGSGGGSGGHVVLHSATGLDLTAIDVGTDPINNPPSTLPESVQAIGGRRGWAGSVLIDDLTGAPSGYDGNGDFMVGRGGAGSNGVIQIHVPDPTTDIGWHSDAEAAIEAYVGSPADTALIEEVLDLYAAPKAFMLVPFYSAESIFQSTWVDTGLALLRAPANGTGPWPNYAHGSLPAFSGTETSQAGSLGNVLASGGVVDQGAIIATGSTAQPTFQATEMSLPLASTLVPEEFLLNAALLIGYDLYPDSSDPAGPGRGFEIVAAEYNRLQDRLILTTRVLDGDLRDALSALNPLWAIRAKFFRLDTTDERDRLPDAAQMTIEFQGADESAPGDNTPGTPTAWTADLADLQGKRFFRYRVTFNIDRLDAGVSLLSERPRMDYLKLPFVW